MRSLLGLVVLTLLLTGCAQETMFIKHRVDNCDRTDLDTARLWKIAGEASKSKDSTLRLNGTKYQFLGESVRGDLSLKETRGKKTIEYSVNRNKCQPDDMYDYITVDIQKNDRRKIQDYSIFKSNGMLGGRYISIELKKSGVYFNKEYPPVRLQLQEYRFSKKGSFIHFLDFDQHFKFKPSAIIKLYKQQIHEYIVGVSRIWYDPTVDQENYKMAQSDFPYHLEHPYYEVTSVVKDESINFGQARLIDGITGQILKSEQRNINSTY